MSKLITTERDGLRCVWILRRLDEHRRDVLCRVYAGDVLVTEMTYPRSGTLEETARGFEAAALTRARLSPYLADRGPA